MRKIYVDDKVRAAADDYAANVFKNRRADFQQPLDLLKKFRDNILSTQDTTQGKVLLAYVDRILAVHFDLLHAEGQECADGVADENQDSVPKEPQKERNTSFLRMDS